ncbi:MAG: tetrahydromethanopterin S-methyltransferase subunit G [Methanimicrococcus sp.]|nr:tetrahydromethanopterin S-methyltransferase subunit G [Methanimicrococcus sp.]
MQDEMNTDDSSLLEYEEITVRLDRLDDKVEFVRAEVAQRTGRKIGRAMGILYGVLAGLFLFLIFIILSLIF